MQNSKEACGTRCWGLAGVIGALTFIVMLAATERSVLGSLLWALVTAGVLGLLFKWLFCKSAEAPAASAQAPRPAAPGAGGEAPRSAGAGAGSATSAGAAGAATAVGAAAAGTTMTGDGASRDLAEAAETESEAGAGTSAAEAQPEVHETTAAPRPEAAGASEAEAKPGETAPASAAPEPQPGTAGASAVEAQPDRPTDEARALVTPSKALAGQQELATRRGTWRYEGRPGPAQATAPAPQAQTPDYDGDGTPEGRDEGRKPLTLDGPRPEGADNLQEISGIGPKLAAQCNALGIWHFDQIASWTAEEVAWMDANLEGFPGRVSRDDWVKQAQALAARGGAPA